MESPRVSPDSHLRSGAAADHRPHASALTALPSRSSRTSRKAVAADQTLQAGDSDLDSLYLPDAEPARCYTVEQIQGCWEAVRARLEV